MKTPRVVFALLSMLLSGSAYGIEVVEGKLFIDGSGQWAYGRTDHNTYFLGALEASPDGEFENTAFVLTLTARPFERVTIFAQPGFIEGRDNLVAALDWTFVDYHLSDLFRFRVGKIKLPFGLSTASWRLWQSSTASRSCTSIATMPTSAKSPR